MLESTGVSENNWEHLHPNSWFSLGCTWAGGCAHRFAQVSLGTPAVCRGLAGFSQAQCSTETGETPSVSEVSEIGAFFSLWLDQRLAEWCQKLSCFWKMGKIDLNFCCRGKYEAAALKSSSAFVCIG